MKESLEDLYARLPKIECKGLCFASCGVVIPYACLPEEEDRIFLPVLQTVRQDMSCAALMLNRCSIYKIRPLICRIWGCVKDMPCPHGCQPEFWLTNEEIRVMLNAHGGKLMEKKLRKFWKK